MYKEMRRKDREIPQEEALQLLAGAEYGTLATADEAGNPYAVPLSFVVMDGQIYFHCALRGHKIDNLAARPAVCFSAVGKTQPVYNKDFSTLFESVVVFGAAHLVENAAEKTAALMALCQKYLPTHMDKAPGDIARSLPATAVYAIKMQHITGKAKRG